MESSHEVQHQGVTTRLELERNRLPAGPHDFLEVTFTVESQASQPHSFTFSSSQEYDFAVLDPARNELWRWSNGRFFAMRMAVKTLDRKAWVYRENIPTVDNQGRPLPHGKYLLHADLTAIPALSNHIPFEVE